MDRTDDRHIPTNHQSAEQPSDQRRPSRQSGRDRSAPTRQANHPSPANAAERAHDPDQPTQDRVQGQDLSAAARQNQGDSAGNRTQKRPPVIGAQPEHRESRKRRKDGADRRGHFGYGDEICRSTCLSQRHNMPDVWPVRTHADLATLRVIEVARRSDEILFCDGDHAGPHIWPDGELIDQGRREATVPGSEASEEKSSL